MADINSNNSTLIVTSSAFKNGETIPKQYSCRGENVNPPLAISGIPPKTNSLALIMHDPDAPSGDYVHWVVWNIPTTATVIGSGSLPAEASQGKNSSGQNKYMGPCPPSGTHHYMFDVYALDEKLNLPEGTNREELVAATKPHIIGSYTLVGLFSTE